MKLTTLIQNFQKNQISKKILRNVDDYAILCKALPKIFPDAEVVEEMLALLRPNPQDKDSNHDYNVANLPVHTRDNEWLTKYIHRIVKVKPNTIQTFVEVDPRFDAARNRYEQDVVRAEIQNQMYDPIAYEKLRNDPYASEDFRDKICQNMTQFGINRHSIETGLELNADLWRKQTMSLAFVNKYLRPIWEEKNQLPFRQYQKLFYKIASRREDWLALQEHEYYQKHQPIIDELGVATKHMKMKSGDMFLKTMAWKSAHQVFKNHFLNRTHTQNDDYVRRNDYGFDSER